MVASATTITDEREETVDFTNPYYLLGAVDPGQEGSDINGLNDLYGKTVGVQQGTTGVELGKEKDNAELRTVPQGPDVIA